MSTSNAFEQHILHKIALQPALIGETVRTIQLSSPSLTLTPTQRELLRHAATNSNSSSSSSAADRYALLQRALVDLPLMPLGGEQLLYEVVWPAFATALTAAEKLREAQQQQDGSKEESVAAAREALKQAREELRQAFAHVRQLVQLLEQRIQEGNAEEKEDTDTTRKRARAEV